MFGVCSSVWTVEYGEYDIIPCCLSGSPSLNTITWSCVKVSTCASVSIVLLLLLHLADRHANETNDLDKSPAAPNVTNHKSECESLNLWDVLAFGSIASHVKAQSWAHPSAIDRGYFGPPPRGPSSRSNEVQMGLRNDGLLPATAPRKITGEEVRCTVST